MSINKIEYYFTEWMIIQKQITEEQFKALTPADFEQLRAEFSKDFFNAVIVDVK